MPFAVAHSCINGDVGNKSCSVLCLRGSMLLPYLDCIPERMIGDQFQMPQPHACHRARPIALCQPFGYALPVICVPSGHDDRVAHKLHGHRTVEAGRSLWHGRLLISSAPVHIGH
eukprot:GHUV01016349.1.p2 GENE.GHUV01016349.1~~GHUV01016349.1.p2  ORF type:complete len:115 (-),score=4.69 GHUV01016349.1:393-737(-)